MTALGFCSMVNSIESLERLERAHELVTSLSVVVLPGALRTEQKNGSWWEALENEMKLKHSMGYHMIAGSKYLVGSSSAPYCNSNLVVVDARTQHRLIDQLFSVPKRRDCRGCRRDPMICQGRSSGQSQRDLGMSWKKKWEKTS